MNKVWTKQLSPGLIICTFSHGMRSSAHSCEQ